MIKALSPPRLAIILLAAALLLYPLVLSGAFYRDVGVTFLLAVDLGDISSTFGERLQFAKPF